MRGKWPFLFISDEIARRNFVFFSFCIGVMCVYCETLLPELEYSNIQWHGRVVLSLKATVTIYSPINKLRKELGYQKRIFCFLLHVVSSYYFTGAGLFTRLYKYQLAKTTALNKLFLCNTKWYITFSLIYTRKSVAYLVHVVWSITSNVNYRKCFEDLTKYLQQFTTNTLVLIALTFKGRYVHLWFMTRNVLHVYLILTKQN